MEEISRYIAGMLRTLREQHGWSLDRTARETGVSKAMLGQIERGESSPTVSTLWKLASGFRVSFSSLLGGGSTTSESVRHAAESVWGEDAAGMQVETLFPFDPWLGFELLVINLAPGAISESAPHARGVVEHLVVVEGELDVCLDDAWQRLATGEGLRFAADRHHAYANATALPARFHNVIHYPRESEALSD